MTRFAALVGISFMFSAASAIAQQPVAGAPAVQRTTDDVMREEKEKADKPRTRRVKVEREVKRPVKPNPLALEGNTFTSASGPRLNPPNTKSTSPEPKAAQTVGTTWTAAVLGDTGAFPPDTMGAVGPTQFVTFVNGRLRTFNKNTGAADGVLNVSPDVFFSSVMTPLGGGVTFNFTSDPHLRYDRFTKRWFMVIIDVPEGGAAANRIMLAVSDAASNGIISGATVWSFFFVQVATDFADYPTLGIDNKGIYIGTNNFTTAGDFVNTNACVVRKSSVLGAGPIVSTTFAGLIGADGPFTPQGVTNLDANASFGYFVGVSNAAFGRLILRRVSNADTVPTLSANLVVNTLSTQFPISVPHLGNTGGANGTLDALDDRLYAATMRNGKLWTAHNIGVISSGVASASATRNAARWYELSNLDVLPAVAQSGTVFDSAASNPQHFWIPTVNVSGQGHAALGFSTAGTTNRINAATAGRLSSDAAGTMQAPVLYTSSATAYNPAADPGGSFGRRFGDYSYTSVDPEDDMTMYTIQEFCNAANTYGVNVAKLLAPPPATPSASVPPAIVEGTGATNITVTGISTADSAFFEPGHTFSKHISATISGGVTVNSVQVINSTTVQIAINAAGAAPGPKNITIINPDNQQRTGSGILQVTPLPAPDIRLSANSHNYGSHALGTITDQGFTIFNDGDAPLQVNSFSGLPAQGFSLVSPPATPFFVAASSSQAITVRYQPAAAGPHNATLTINSNDGDTPAANIGLSGTGTNCLPDNLPVSAVSPIDLVGAFSALVTVKNSATKGTSIKSKMTITQQVLGAADVATPGAPVTAVSLYLLDSNAIPCTLPTAIATIPTKASKPGKPGLPAKQAKVKIKVQLASTPSVTGKFLMAVVDAPNSISEKNKANNFVISGPLP